MFPVTDVIPSRTTPYVTIGLIAVNVAAFIAELLLGDRLAHFLLAFGLVPAYFSWWTVATSMFLHAGWIHLLGNMLYLWLFADNIEDRLGHGWFILFYLACGAAAALGHMAFNPQSSIPMVGASGAVSGVIGAYFVLYPSSRVLTAVFLLVTIDLVEVPAVFFLGVWFLLQLFSGGSSAIAAHIVGLLAGGLVGVVCRLVCKMSPRY